nr:hypothetical protein [Tanacetum cinerariifolium]
MLVICNAAELVIFQAPYTSTYNNKKVSQGKKPGAKIRHKKKQTSSTTKYHPMSKIEATKSMPPLKKATESQTSHSGKRKKSDKFNTFPDLSNSDDAPKEIKMEDLSKRVKDIGINLTDLDSSKDDQPFIVQDEDEEEIHAEAHKEPKVLKQYARESKVIAKPKAALLKAQPSFPNFYILTKLKELPSKFSKICREIKDLKSPQKTSSKPKGELITNKGKEAMSHEEAKEKESKSDSETEVKLSGSMTNEQKKIKQLVKDDMAKKEVEPGKGELIDLPGIYVVKNMYKAKVKYDKFCNKMLNRRNIGKITNYDVLARGKGHITLKVYRDDGSNEIIPNFKASDLHIDFTKGMAKMILPGLSVPSYLLKLTRGTRIPQVNKGH